ncbi:MAG: hypothetical protein JO316_16140 [Abitibacteriaceae bacterium]|nr:hypothetical protein [Abditibacteriaceae bacterium]
MSLQTPPQAGADDEAAIEQCLREIRQLNEQMQQDRTEIERLKVETHTLKHETRALLASMGAKV